MTQNASQSQWHVDGTTARLDSGRFVATMDLLRPQLGLTQIQIDGRPILGCVPLQVTPGPPTNEGVETAVDCYVREREVVATYAQTAKRSVQPTYSWRLLESVPGALGVELIVSMQTSLLKSNPSVSVVSACRGVAHWVCDGNATPIDGRDWESPKSKGRASSEARATAGLVVVRLDDAVSYAEIVFPTDFLGARVVARHDASHLVHRMFPDDLEKGVIRRGRIRSLFLPTENDFQTAWSAYEQLAAEEPPLTT